MSVRFGGTTRRVVDRDDSDCLSWHVRQLPTENRRHLAIGPAGILCSCGGGAESGHRSAPNRHCSMGPEMTNFAALRCARSILPSAIASTSGASFSPARSRWYTSSLNRTFRFMPRQHSSRGLGSARCGSASPCQYAAGSLSRGIRKVVGERSECLKDFLCMSTALHSLDQLVVEALVRQENGTFGLHSSNRRVDIS